MVTRKEEKIEKLINGNRVFLITETERHRYFKVKGLSNEIYDVIFNKEDESFSCSCLNVRLSDCYHISACRKYNSEKQHLEATNERNKKEGTYTKLPNI